MIDANEEVERLTQRYRCHGVPEHCCDGLAQYVVHGLEPGSFLCAVLEDSLTAAAGKADHINQQALFAYAVALYNDVPHDAWGNNERVRGWIQHRGLVGLESEEK